jgi:hypothetical protein
MTLGEARNRLAWIWFPVCGVLILVLIFQSVFGAYGTRETEAWGWAMPNFFPTLALMMSVFGANALGGTETEKTPVKRSYFWISVGLSFFYRFVLVFILVAPLLFHFLLDRAATPQLRLDIMLDSNVYLGPIQSLVVGALGVLFFLKEKTAADQAGGQEAAGEVVE